MKTLKRWPMTCALVAVAIGAIFIQVLVALLVALVIVVNLPDDWS